MEYARTAIPELIALFGPFDAAYLGGMTARLIGMQFYAETAHAMGPPGRGDAEEFARFMVALAEAQGDRAQWRAGPQGPVVQQTSWKLMSGIPALSAAAFDTWNQLLDGALLAHNRRLQLKVERRLDQGDGAFEWRIAPRPTQSEF